MWIGTKKVMTQTTRCQLHCRYRPVLQPLHWWVTGLGSALDPPYSANSLLSLVCGGNCSLWGRGLGLLLFFVPSSAEQNSLPQKSPDRWMPHVDTARLCKTMVCQLLIRRLGRGGDYPSMTSQVHRLLIGQYLHVIIELLSYNNPGRSVHLISYVIERINRMCLLWVPCWC